MKKTRLLLLMLLALTGWVRVAADTVSPYNVDFEKAISTSSHDFAVASNWGHIVGKYEDSWGDGYMSYTYSTNEGIGGSATLLAYKQYAQNMYGDGAVCYDLLVTPKVSGTVTMYVKPNSSANYSYPAMVEIYDVDETGTTRGSLIQKFTADNGFVADETNDGWYTITLSVETEKRLGIRAQYVYMDNFSATSATIVAEKKLSIASAEPSATTGTIKWDQQENGKVLVKYTVTVTNTGEVAFAGNEDGYSVSIFNRKTNEVYTTVTIPQALGIGETSEPFDVAVELDASTWPNSYTYINMDLKENISNSVVQRAQSHYNAYEPKFVFREGGSTSTSSLYADIAFGKVTEETSKTYEIYNDGLAPLQIVSITVPAGFTVSNAGNFTVASKENQPFTITLSNVPGIYSGNLEVKYLDKDGVEKSYTKTITGTVLDPSKNIITFDDGAGNALYPQGSVRYTAYISSEGSGSTKNYYLQGSGSNPLWITPLMKATDGENISFDAEYTSYSSGKVEVMISTDRQNWTTIQTVSNIASQYNWTTYTAQIPEAGDYYIGFKLTSSKIDNIYGLVYATAPAHDLLLVKSNIPTTGKQNNDYKASISVGNVGPNVETAGNYTATLYVDGEAVATSNNVDLPVAVISGNYNNGDEDNYTTLSFTFKPHIVGTYPAYIEVKSGDAVVKTEEVSLTISQEVLENDIAVGYPNTTSSYAPFYPSWWDDGSNSDFYYTSEQLAQFGIGENDVITAITFKGTPQANKSFSNLKLEAWVALESGTFEAGVVDTENMKHVVVFDGSKDFTSGKSEDFVIDLSDSPIIYDGTSNLRVYTYGKGSTYVSFNFEVDNTIPNQAYYRYKTNAFSNSTNLPVAHLSLAVQPTTFSGVVTGSDETPVEGATVTIRNDANDIEYFATTDETGAYTINVVQNEMAFTTTVTATGYETLVDDEEIDFTEESKTKNFTLIKLDPVIVSISQYGYSSFYYSNYAFDIPEGVTAYAVENVSGKSLTLVEVENVIPAGCGVLLEGPANEEYTLEYADNPKVSYENMLSGTDETTLIEAEEGYKYYVLSAKNDKVGFYFGAENGGSFTNNAHRAYLAVPVTSANNVSAFFFDNATSIDAVSTNVDDSNAPAYNLAGQRVNKNYKGVVIVNGKKMLKR